MKLKGNPKKARLIGCLLLLAGFLTLLLEGTFFTLPDAGMAAVAVVAFALLIAAALVFFLFWRCPCCGRGLRGIFGVDYCPFCGARLDRQTPP